MQQHGFRIIVHTSGICWRIYAISVERKIKNLAVVAVSEAAPQKIFGQELFVPGRRLALMAAASGRTWFPASIS